MKRRYFKLLLWVTAMAALMVNSFTQDRLNRQRADLNLTRMAPLENAPPILAFTTVALGGFRGIIVNFLWIRANQLQLEGKYFETLTLGDWITKLQPTFAPVWTYHAWNMAYNISRTFQDPAERWNWVKAGYELLRDDGIRYNPTHADMYRELAWIYYDKIGRFGEEEHFAYKRFFGMDMARFFPNGRPPIELFLNPQTEGQREAVRVLKEQYKLDPEWIKYIDEQWGPLDWRLPETHAIYWADLGRKRAKEGDQLVLHRALWQSMQLAFQRGRIVVNPVDGEVHFSPNIDIIPKVSATYEEIQKLMPEKKEYVGRGHKNFLSDAIYNLYLHNRPADAAKWYEYLRKRYPEADWVELSLDDYVNQRITDEVDGGKVFKIKAIVEGFIEKYYMYRAIGEDEQAEGHSHVAKLIYDKYQDKLVPGQLDSQALPPFRDMQVAKLTEALSGKGSYSPELSERLRLRFGLSKDWKKELNLLAEEKVKPGTPVEKK